METQISYRLLFGHIAAFSASHVQHYSASSSFLSSFGHISVFSVSHVQNTPAYFPLLASFGHTPALPALPCPKYSYFFLSASFFWTYTYFSCTPMSKITYFSPPTTLPVPAPIEFAPAALTFAACCTSPAYIFPLLLQKKKVPL